MSAAAAAAVLAASMRLVASHAYADGAPPGFSGGFKEQSCHACHFDAEPNTSPGRVIIDGAPAAYEPGARYTLTITLTRTEMKRAGFQLVSRFEGTGAQAGTLAPGPDDKERVALATAAGIQYAGQTEAGSSVATAGAVRWTVEWTAPRGGGPVAFHVAANAADGNGSADGDFVYAAAERSESPP